MTCPDEFPDGRFACELPEGHNGSHRDHQVSWSAVGSQVPDRHSAAEEDW